MNLAKGCELLQDQFLLFFQKQKHQVKSCENVNIEELKAQKVMYGGMLFETPNFLPLIIVHAKYVSW